ncbi:MAG: hypothetical protein J7L20_05020 [Thermoplasmata archaeon]|nr:hypothetical protein [Thermoplasmata archaeon]
MITLEDIEKFSGKWILIIGDEIVNCSYSLEEMLKEAEEYPPEEVAIAKIPPKPFIPR